MGLKTIRVRIKSVDEALADAIGVMRAVEAGKRVKKRGANYFESLEAVRAALTEKRLALLRVIREREPDSVAELARLVKRDFKSVHRDVHVLQDLRLISVPKTKRGVSSRLRSKATEIVLRIAV
jgi:predicted transcriptional regulator